MFQEQANQLEQQITQAANPSQEAPGKPSPEGQAPEAKPTAVADLSKFEKILLDGEELSPQDLKKQRMLEADYRRKTTELAEARRQHEEGAKYDVNFRHDLQVLMDQPWRASEFYKLYPPEYHAQARKIEQMYKANPGLWTQGETAESQTDNSDLEKLVEERINQRLKPIEEREQRETQKAHLAQLDAIETKMSAKYKRANKFEVYAAAEYLSKDGKELTDKDWERIYKDSHDRNLSMIKQAYAEEFNQQKAVNQKLKDVAPGGGVPGEAPVVAKNLKEAKDLWMKSMGQP